MATHHTVYSLSQKSDMLNYEFKINCYYGRPM